MRAVSSEAEYLISTHQLGTVRRVYKPSTVILLLGGGSFVLLACALLTWPVFLFIALTRSGNMVFHNGYLWIPTPVVFVFFLFYVCGCFWGLIFFEWGVKILYKGCSNRKARAILCTHGVVSLGRTHADAFRWDQVTSVAHTVVPLPYDEMNRESWLSKHTGLQHRHPVPLSHLPGLGKNALTTIYSLHRWTVRCKQKRIFVFESVLTGGKNFGKTIVAEVTRMRQET